MKIDRDRETRIEKLKQQTYDRELERKLLQEKQKEYEERMKDRPTPVHKRLERNFKATTLLPELENRSEVLLKRKQDLPPVNIKEIQKHSRHYELIQKQKKEIIEKKRLDHLQELKHLKDHQKAYYRPKISQLLEKEQHQELESKQREDSIKKRAASPPESAHLRPHDQGSIQAQSLTRQTTRTPKPD